MNRADGPPYENIPETWGVAPGWYESRAVGPELAINHQRPNSHAAIIDQLGNLAAELRAGDDAVDEAVLHQEFAGLEARR